MLALFPYSNNYNSNLKSTYRKSTDQSQYIKTKIKSTLPEGNNPEKMKHKVSNSISEEETKRRLDSNESVSSPSRNFRNVEELKLPPITTMRADKFRDASNDLPSVELEQEIDSGMVQEIREANSEALSEERKVNAHRKSGDNLTSDTKFKGSNKCRN